MSRGHPERVVVAGAGHAAGTLAAVLRQRGFGGAITLVGAEPHPPYHRPPLSKRLGGPVEPQWLRERAFYDEQGVELLLGERIEAADPAARTATTSTGRTLPYDVLVLATGARPRTLTVPGAAAAGVVSLRTVDDADALRGLLADGGPLVVVGGGYVGLELAAAARGAGIETTVLEREERVLARVASTDLSAILTRFHDSRGTVIRTGAQVVAFASEGGALRGVHLADGTLVRAQVAVVGVGAMPCDELGAAVGAELAPGGGVLVDEGARTSVDGVLAVGDATVRRSAGGPTRFESIPSAVEQAGQAAATILGQVPADADVPWFWSDQFDLKLKIAGLLRAPYDTVVRGDPASGSFALLHHRDGELVAVEAANANGEFMAAKRLLATRRILDPARLEDPDLSLRELALA